MTLTKIIENNFAKSEGSKEIVCPYCDSVFLADKTDFSDIGTVECPCCETEFVPEDKGFSYPESFYSFADGVDVSNDEINDYIARGIETLKRDDEYKFYTISTGNAFIGVFKYDGDGEYQIIVTKNYSEAYRNIQENEP